MQNSGYHGGPTDLTFSNDVIIANSLDAWFDPAPNVIEAIKSNVANLLKTSPPQKPQEMIDAIALWRSLDKEGISIGAGSSDLTYTIFSTLLDSTMNVMVVDPMYSEYVNCLQKIGAKISRHFLLSSKQFAFNIDDLILDIKRTEPHMVIIVNPNSPTGTYCTKDDLLYLSTHFSHTLFLVDEAYIDFADPTNSIEPFHRENVITLKTLSKCFALSGARVAYCSSNKYLAKKINDRTPPWCVSNPAQIAAIEAIKNLDYYAEKYKQTTQYRNECVKALQKLTVLNSVANFYLIQVNNASRVCNELEDKKIYVRNCDSMSMQLSNNFIRVTVKDKDTNSNITKNLLEVIK